MESPSYGIVKELPDLSYEDAVQRTTEALSTEGFGILTEIDVKATLKEKLDADFRKYVILGACNPHFAHQALNSETFIGLLMPCNVVVMEGDQGGSVVSALNPREVFGLVNRPEVEPLAEEVTEMLKRVLDRI